MIRLLRSLHRDEGGAAIIELALVAPLLALMTIGIVDMSNAFSAKLQLEQAGQRAVEKVMQTTGELTVEDTIAAEAVCQFNGTDADGDCRDAPLTTDDVAVTHRLECDGVLKVTTDTDQDCATGEKESRWIEVKIDYNFTPTFPIHFAGYSDGTYHMSTIAGMRTE
jgi:Flp pilus assembly protein TadG